MDQNIRDSAAPQVGDDYDAPPTDDRVRKVQADLERSTDLSDLREPGADPEPCQDDPAAHSRRGSFEGAYGDESDESWQAAQAAMRTAHPTAPRPSAMGGVSTGYDEATGFASDHDADSDEPSHK
jgi:hypothetical protein